MTANSFMQNPVGYAIQNGRAEMNDVLGLFTNPKLLVAYPHTIFASLATGAFMIMSIAAFNLIKKREVDFFKRSMNIALIIGIISTLGVILSGHSQTSYLVESQPMKIAAAEGLWEDSGDPAAWSVLAGIDVENQENTWNLEIPGLLSFLTYGEFSGKVDGMLKLQEQYVQQFGEGNYIPPVKTTYWSFRAMIFSGGLMLLFAAIGIIQHWRKKLEHSTRFLKFLVPAFILPYIANTAGWFMAEIGRQPWVVNGLMTTESGISQMLHQEKSCSH